MTTLQGTAPVRPVEAQLADLICADPDLLQAEFDAIISAGWDNDAPPDGPRRPGRPPAPRPVWPRPPARADHARPHPPEQPTARRLQLRAGQRAPPHSPTPDRTERHGEGRHSH